MQKYFEPMLLTVLHGLANGKESKHFLLLRRKLYIFRVYCLGTQTSKRLENIVSVFEMLPCLYPHVTHVKNKICCLKAEKVFENLQKHFLRPGRRRNFASAANFLVCAFKHKQKDLKVRKKDHWRPYAKRTVLPRPSISAVLCKVSILS